MTNINEMNSFGNKEQVSVNFKRLEKSLRDFTRNMIIKNKNLDAKNMAQKERDFLSSQVLEKVYGIFYK
jgi:uncharacterized protein YpuA (DUF1002 family)